ncbi:MAG: protein-disulfide reductase DsbD domain-containing protein, partial [Alphaproteobacteria bacterium]
MLMTMQRNMPILPSLRRFLTILPVLALTAAGGVAQADEMASAWDVGEKARVRLVAATTAVGTLESLVVGLEVELEQGWKTYWRSPGDAGIPPHLEWDDSDNLGEINFRWPAPHRFSYYGIDTFGYEDRIIYPIDVTP